ncbi:hypothetical protein BI364_10340 [Acidihalobacter yilgarnensis]|uniref:Uncharacterized protein n=1 Tax=Acidihalobacter yilgarnensis TaxID=2819280 RepID=A0A1D8IPH1_9GAMM|nr:hypothetical protein BI364_10340 [Acidihalobacter yilgarnensis]
MLNTIGLLLPYNQASQIEARAFIERKRLCGLVCRLENIMLLASIRVKPGAQLWRLDKPLASLAQHFDVAYRPLSQPGYFTTLHGTRL